MFASAACIWGGVLEIEMQHYPKHSVSAAWAAMLFVLVSFAEVFFTTNILKFVAILHPGTASQQQALFYFMIGVGTVLLDLVEYVASLAGSARAAQDQYFISAAVIFASAVLFGYFSLRTVAAQH